MSFWVVQSAPPCTDAALPGRREETVTMVTRLIPSQRCSIMKYFSMRFRVSTQNFNYWRQIKIFKEGCWFSIQYSQMRLWQKSVRTMIIIFLMRERRFVSKNLLLQAACAEIYARQTAPPANMPSYLGST